MHSLIFVEIDFKTEYTCFLSDIIVQIVDARNPLLFRCEDLESYVRELSVGNKKLNVILVNKADLLTDEQR